MKKEKRFDVVIKNMKGKVVSVIGRNLNEDRAEKRLMTGLMRINPSSYFVATIPHKARP